MAAYAELEETNPNLRRQYQDWQHLRLDMGDDHTDYQAFRRHGMLRGSHAASPWRSTCAWGSSRREQSDRSSGPGRHTVGQRRRISLPKRRSPPHARGRCRLMGVSAFTSASSTKTMPVRHAREHLETRDGACGAETELLRHGRCMGVSACLSPPTLHRSMPAEPADAAGDERRS